jgi:hypothetical protein
MDGFGGFIGVCDSMVEAVKAKAVKVPIKATGQTKLEIMLNLEAETICQCIQCGKVGPHTRISHSTETVSDRTSGRTGMKGIKCAMKIPEMGLIVAFKSLIKLLK